MFYCLFTGKKLSNNSDFFEFSLLTHFFLVLASDYSIRLDEVEIIGLLYPVATVTAEKRDYAGIYKKEYYWLLSPSINLETFRKK